LVLRSRRKLKIARDEKGQILVWVLVVMIFGSIVIGPLLAYASTSLMLTSNTGDNIDAYYAAEAGVDWAIIELVQAREEGPEADQGAGAYYTPSDPPPTVGAYNATITIVEASDAPAPIETLYAYLDPFDEDHGADFTNGNLTALAPGGYGLFQVYVPGSEDIRVNWAFTFEGSYIVQLLLYKGQYDTWPVGPFVEDELGNGSESPAALNLVYSVTEPGWYTVVFYNVPGSATINSKIYVGGNPECTWVRVQGYQDYIITSSAKDAVGNVRATVTAYVRQTPGPSKYWLSQQISVFSWQID